MTDVERVKNIIRHALIETLNGLVSHLQENRHKIIHLETVQYSDHDPTYGEQVRSKEIEVLDFDALLREIDDFAEEFRQ